MVHWTKLFQQFLGDAFGHGFVSLCAWVQMIARVEIVCESLGVVVPADGFVEIDATVKVGSGSQPFVERHADKVTILVVSSPTVYR